MTTQNVNIIITVKAQGVDQIKQVSDQLNTLKGTADNTSTSLTKQIGQTDLMTNSLTKMAPPLQQLNPLLGSVGLSGILSLALPAAIGTAIVSLVAMSKTFEDLDASLVTFGAISNQYTLGPMMDFNQTLRLTSSLALQLGVPLDSISMAMQGLDQTTRSNNVSQSMLVDAMRIVDATGLSLKTVLQDLTNAYNGEYVNGQFMIGEQAVQAVTADLMSQKSAIGGLNGTMGELASQGLSTVKTGLGAIGDALKLVGEAFLAGFAPSTAGKLDAAVASIFKDVQSFMDTAWSGVLLDLKTIWDKTVKIGDWLSKMGQDALTWLDGTVLGFFQRGIGDIVSWIKNTFSNLWGDITRDFSSLFGGQSSKASGGSTIPQQAGGGITTSPGLSLVGENGPELLNLPVGASVIPLSGGGAGGQNIYVTINVQGSVMAEQELSTLVSNNIMEVIRGRGGY